MLAAGFKSAADQIKTDLDKQLREKSLGMRYLNKQYEKKDR
jgi:hypothetical protein